MSKYFSIIPGQRFGRSDWEEKKLSLFHAPDPDEFLYFPETYDASVYRFKIKPFCDFHDHIDSWIVQYQIPRNGGDIIASINIHDQINFPKTKLILNEARSISLSSWYNLLWLPYWKFDRCFTLEQKWHMSQESEESDNPPPLEIIVEMIHLQPALRERLDTTLFVSFDGYFWPASVE